MLTLTTWLPAKCVSATLCLPRVVLEADLPAATATAAVPAGVMLGPWSQPALQRHSPAVTLMTAAAADLHGQG